MFRNKDIFIVGDIILHERLASVDVKTADAALLTFRSAIRGLDPKIAAAAVQLHSAMISKFCVLTHVGAIYCEFRQNAGQLFQGTAEMERLKAITRSRIRHVYALYPPVATH